MSITFNAIVVRHERRIRLVFSEALDVSAFGAPAPSNYIVTNQDARGISPVVDAALLVPDSPNIVELALGNDLAPNASYQVSAIGVEGADTTVTDGTAILPFLYAVATPLAASNPVQDLRAKLLYGTDLIWDGTDYQETPNGDLAQVSGTPNVTKALERGAETNSLPWDPSWGAGAREFVDGPSVASGTLVGALVKQAMKDPRVKSVKSTVNVDGDSTYVELTPTLFTGEQLEPVSATVPS